MNTNSRFYRNTLSPVTTVAGGKYTTNNLKASESKLATYWNQREYLLNKAKSEEGFLTNQAISEMNVDGVFAVMVDIYSHRATPLGRYGVALDERLKHCKRILSIRRFNTYLQLIKAAKKQGFAILAEKEGNKDDD